MERKVLTAPALPVAWSDAPERLRGSQPGLALKPREGRWRIVGRLVIAHDAEVLDAYEIEIRFGPSPQRDFPTTRETGGRIPRTPDRHVNPDGTLCVCVPDEYFARNGRVHPVSFVDGPVRSFFLWQSLVEVRRAQAIGERGHGAAGIAEFYAGQLGTASSRAARDLLDVLLATAVRPRKPCPCGSNLALGACHLSLVRGLRKAIPRRVLRESRRKLQERE